MRKRLLRALFGLTPVHARPLQLKRALGRTRAGGVAKRLRRRATEPATPPAARVPARGGERILLVSHCDFTGNSAYHVHALAGALGAHGWKVAIAAPSRRGLSELAPTDVPVHTYREARRLQFDLVHAFTPRAHVQSFVAAMGTAYVVHLEDNEAVLAETVAGAVDALAASSFVANAVGATVLVDRLLELVPPDRPHAVWWPGYDERLDAVTRTRDETRRAIGLDASDVAVVYTGNIHASNSQDIAALYDAVAAARRRDSRIVLVRSGWSSVPRRALPSLGPALVDLGWIARRRVLELVRAADVLVQPGGPDAFNDYRFPSKLPDFLASGNPVILPRTNLGLALHAERDALVLDSGSVGELAHAVLRLAGDQPLRRALGKDGRAFAREHLRWAHAAERVDAVYEAVLRD